VDLILARIVYVTKYLDMVNINRKHYWKVEGIIIYLMKFCANCDVEVTDGTEVTQQTRHYTIRKGSILWPYHPSFLQSRIYGIMASS
jgi:hypothetical protein